MFYLVFLFFVITPCFAEEKKDPFSKITITSQSAFFGKAGPSLFNVQYKKDVLVTLADSSTIKSDLLEASFRGKEALEKIVFKNNVFVTREHRKISADYVELIIEEKMCKLKGHVKIEQKKTDKDVPLITECEEALVKWESDELTLVGSESSPVNTTIELGGKLRLFGKKTKKG